MDPYRYLALINEAAVGVFLINELPTATLTEVARAGMSVPDFLTDVADAVLELIDGIPDPDQPELPL